MCGTWLSRYVGSLGIYYSIANDFSQQAMISLFIKRCKKGKADGNEDTDNEADNKNEDLSDKDDDEVRASIGNGDGNGNDVEDTNKGAEGDENRDDYKLDPDHEKADDETIKAIIKEVETTWSQISKEKQLS